MKLISIFKRKKKIIIPIGVLLLILTIVYFNFKHKGEVKKVQVEEVKRGEIKAIVNAPGRVNPKTVVNISSDIMGKIVELNVKEGDQVQKGQILALLDDTREKSELESATANLKFVERSFERKKKLFSEDLISNEEFQQAEAEFKTTLMRFENARKTYEKTQILSPISGNITRLIVEEGEIVVTGTMNNPGTVLMTISDLTEMEVTASVDESEVVDVRIEQPVEIEIDAYPDTTYKGEVREIANTGTTKSERSFEETTNFEVTVTVLESEHTLRPGMTASVDIITAERDTTTLKVPIQSVVLKKPDEEKEEGNPGKEENDENRRKKKKTDFKKEEGVFVVNEGSVKFKLVKTGISDETHIEILEGIEEGEKIVIGPFRTLNDLKDGDLVKIEKESGKEKKKERRK